MDARTAAHADVARAALDEAIAALVSPGYLGRAERERLAERLMTGRLALAELEAAPAAERERCARIAEDMDAIGPGHARDVFRFAAVTIAAALRGRAAAV